MTIMPGLKCGKRHLKKLIQSVFGIHSMHGGGFQVKCQSRTLNPIIRFFGDLQQCGSDVSVGTFVKKLRVKWCICAAAINKSIGNFYRTSAQQCLSVRLLRSCSVSKRLNTSSYFLQHNMVAQSFYFPSTKHVCKIRMGPPNGVLQYRWRI